MEKKEKSIKFNLVMNMLLTTSAFLFPLITFPYITRVLLPEGNGKIVPIYGKASLYKWL